MNVFGEFFIIESFDIQSKPLIMSIPAQKEYFKKYLSQKYEDKYLDDMINAFYNEYSKVKVFKISMSKEYIVFALTKNGITEIHFNDFTKVNVHELTGDENVPLSVFSKVFNLIYWFCMKDGADIVLRHSDEDRVKFYAKISRKIIEKHGLKYSIEISLDKVLLQKVHHVSSIETVIEKVLNK